MKRIPFLSNSARRGLLFLEWIIIIVVIGSFIWSWYEPKEKSGPEKELPTTSYAKKQTNPPVLPIMLSPRRRWRPFLSTQIQPTALRS